MMKKTLFLLVALLTSACSTSEQVREPNIVYNEYDGQRCNPYTGICRRAANKYVVENADNNNHNYRPTTNIVSTGQYKHCSDVIFGDPVPAPKYVANGPKVINENAQPVTRQVQYVRPAQPIQYVQQPVQYVQQPAVQYVQPVATTQPCNGCQPTVTQSREPVEVLFKKTVTTTVYEPKTTQDVSYEKEAYAGQVNLPVQNVPTVVQAPALTMPAPTVVTVPSPTIVTMPAQVVSAPVQPVSMPTMVVPSRPVPEAVLVSEITMDPAEVK